MISFADEESENMILGGTWKIEKSKVTLKARWFCVNECDANLRVRFIASFYWIASCIALRRGLGTPIFLYRAL